MTRLNSPSNEAEASVAAPAVPVMTGTHFNVLDEKGRIIIPAKLRPALTEQFWMMLDENDNAAIYNYTTGLDVLAHCERMMREHPGDEDIAAAVERITGAADLVTVEGAWRVQVSQILRFHAQLEKEVVVVGIINHAVIWSRERWETAQTRRLQSVEVRRAQAEMLRAAASGVRRMEAPEVVAPPVEIPVEEIHVPAIATGTGGAIVGAGAGESAGPATPPASHGKRSSRLLTLSQLGR